MSMSLPLKVLEKTTKSTALLENLKQVEGFLVEKADHQRKLGYGDPVLAVGRIVSRLNLPKVESFCTEIEKPSSDFFTYFVPTSSHISHAVGSNYGTLPQLPKLIFLVLQKDLEGCEVRLQSSNSDRYTAPVPLIPSPQLALAERVRELCPTSKFHLAFVPAWELTQYDPALIAEIDNRYFQVGDAWDGDKAILEEMLVPKDKIAEILS